MKSPVQVLFASCSEDLVPGFIEHLKAIYSDIPVAVVSEFPIRNERWIPYHIGRSLKENLEHCRASLHGNRIQLSAVVLQPNMPYWRMRLLGLLLAPSRFLAFNEHGGHFMLRPRSLGAILNHGRWRAGNWIRWQSSPGGTLYTAAWRMTHPRSWARPFFLMRARVAARIARLRRSRQAPVELATPGFRRPSGISVVIPSRNGRELLARNLPSVLRALESIPSEVIVVDNGSDDGTAAWLEQEFASVTVRVHSQPLSFARAVNDGIAEAQFAQVCLLNNDMMVSQPFFRSLQEPFERAPNLFCTTAHIFFPEGVRREETGKAVMPGVRGEGFPVSCAVPGAVEDGSYVLYGSGGCSLYDAGKLAQLGGFAEIFEPAYVEDLDLGMRAWQQGWPSIFAREARVEHHHRATTSRYYTPESLRFVLEVNYLRFLVATIDEAGVFRRLWRENLHRLNLLASRPDHDESSLLALRFAGKAAQWVRPRFKSLVSDSEILALNDGSVAVTPGTAPCGKPVILVVSPYLPFPLSHGGAVRMFNLMSRAAAQFDQVLISFVDGAVDVPPELRAICTEVVTVTRTGSHAHPSGHRPDVVEDFDRASFHAALRWTMRKWKPAIAQLEFTQMAQYAADCEGAKTVLAEHDVTIDLYQQLLAGGEDWELRRQLNRWIPFETGAWKNVDRVIAMSDKDAAAVGPKAVVLGNGVDLVRFRPSPREPEPNRILFIGSFAHLPNVLALEFFLREAWPLLRELQPTLHIIAGARHQYFLDHYRERVAPNLEQPGIVLEGFVSDVRPAYEAASVVIAPLLASAGTNIKVMEAMAMGKAVVSTPGGINGLRLSPGRDVLVAEGGPRFAESVRLMLQDRSKRQVIEREARCTVEREFDWDAIAAKQNEFYAELAGIPQPSLRAKAT